MSIRRINSTGRIKILREDAQVILDTAPDGTLTFAASLNLADYGLPDEALVFLEAYRQTTFMRFPHGTVANPTKAGEPLRLTEFPVRDGLLFRVKVTSAGNRAGVLLAEADRIPVSDDEEQPENRIALLPTATEDLGDEIWQVDFGGGSGPQLLINTRVGDWKGVARAPLFRAVVYPSAMRQVLWQIYKVEETRHMDDLTDWRCRWLLFASALPGVGDPPLTSNDDDDWSNWIENAVLVFSRHHKMLDHFKSEFTRLMEAQP